MHVVVIKYMQLLCITVFFTNNVGCDQMLLQNGREDKQLYLIASCMAVCTRDDPTMKFETCYRTCNEQLFVETMTNITNSNIFIRLICRDDTSLVIKVENLMDMMDKDDQNDSVIVEYDRVKHKKTKRSGPERYYENASDRKTTNEVYENDEKRVFIYLIKVQASDDPMDEKMIYVTNSSISRIENLVADKNYTITVTVTTSNYEYAYANETVQYSTLKLNYTPAEIKDVFVEGYELDKQNTSFFKAHIVWAPAQDMTCHYDILCFSPDISNFDITPVEIRKPEELYRYTIKYLHFGSGYSLSIRGKNTKDSGRESNVTWHPIQTPSCLDWYKNDLNKCAPPTPIKITAVETYVSENNYDVNISWALPQLIPNYYLIKIFDMSPPEFHEPFSETLNVTGNSTDVRFKNIELNGLQYDIKLTAVSNGGNSTITVNRHIDRNLFVTNKRRIVKIILAVIAPLFLLAMGFLVIILICHRRAKLKRYEERCRYFEELEQKAPIDPNSAFNLKSKDILHLDELETVLHTDIIDCTLFINDNDNMEVPRSSIKILGILGEGAFGLVKKGILVQEQGIEREVAVKMLKDKPSTDDYMEFRREIVVLKSVGRHPNIVGIIGHCTKNRSQLMLLTEYCCKGNLLNYLRSEWQRLSQKCSTTTKSRNQLFQALHNHNSDQDHHKNTTSDSECHTPSLASQKTPESVFNFDTSFVDKSFKYKNVTDDMHTDTNQTIDLDVVNAIANEEEIFQVTDTSIASHLNYLNSTHVHANNIEFNTTNLIINKLYDEYTIDNTKCTNSCKCNVEIYDKNNTDNASNNNINNNNNNNDDNGSEFCATSLKLNYSTIDQPNSEPSSVADTKKTKIKIKDCECYMNSCNNINNNSINSNSSNNNLDQINKKLNKIKNYCDTPTTTMTNIDNNDSKSQLICDNSNGSSNNSDNNNSNGNEIFYSNSNVNNIIDSDEKFANHFTEQFQAMNNKWNDQNDFITSEDLLSFAKQICAGMEFLSKNKVVHRDLAARNVLVADDKTVKIADFGLSRDIYQDNIYKKTGNGKLPIKWLALESMTHQIYTSQSDVWSYGILLYEIVTLGGNPYPSIPTNRLLKLLKAGYRMKKPVNCSQDIYNLMYTCWNANPQSRPTFSEIISKLEQQSWDFVNLEFSAEKQRSRSSKSSSESYLKPI